MSPWSRQAKLGFLVLLCAVFAVALISCAPGGLGEKINGWSPVIVEDGIVYVGTKQGQVKALEDGGFDSQLLGPYGSINWLSRRTCHLPVAISLPVPPTLKRRSSATGPLEAVGWD